MKIDGTIYIWKLDPSKDPATHTTFGNDEDDRYNQEIWSVHTSLMEYGHYFSFQILLNHINLPFFHL